MASDADRTPTRTRRPQAPEGPWLSTNESAEYLGVSRPTVYRLMSEGRLAWSLVGKRRRLAIAELDRYARSRRRAS